MFEPESDNISRLHWAKDESEPRCFEKGCSVEFSFTVRRHHCRRCGHIFCDKHLQCLRRLSKNATPGVTGTWAKVCKTCHHKGNQLIGRVSDLSTAFVNKRVELLASAIEHGVGIMMQLSLETPTKLSEKEIIRAEDGIIHCRGCGAKFGVTTWRNTCHICLTVICSKCISSVTISTAEARHCELMLTDQFDFYDSLIDSNGAEPADAAATVLQPRPCCKMCSERVAHLRKRAAFARECVRWREDKLVQLYSRGVLAREIMQTAVPRFVTFAEKALEAKASEKDRMYELCIPMLQDANQSVDQLQSVIANARRIQGDSAQLATIRKNVGSGFLVNIQDLTPNLRATQRKLFSAELEAVKNAYIFMYQLAVESQRRSIWFKQYLARPFLDALKIVIADVQTSVFDSGKDWRKFKKEVDAFLDAWEHTAAPLIPSSLRNDAEVLGKGMEILLHIQNQLGEKTASFRQIKTKQQVRELVSTLQVLCKK